MIISKNQKLNFFFSFNKNFYDIICIGNKAEKVAKLVKKRNNKISMKKLFIKSSNTYFEQSLAILGQQEITMSQKTHKNTDTLLRNQVIKVDPDRNILILRNGEQLKYKHLIFSGQDNEWKDRDTIVGLRQALQNNYTSTYADIQGSKVQQLYNKVNSEIYFSMNSDRHFGADNYFMLHLADNLKRISKQYGYDPKSTKIKILNQSKTLIPYNLEVDSLIKNLLQQNNVEIIENCRVQEVSHRKRQICVQINNTKKVINYGGYYQYLPFKVPDFLKESKIDPFNLDQKTLINKNYPTIHIVGNILPTTYSFYAYNYMAHTVAQNIINMELKSNNLAVYKGDTAITFWTGKDSLRYFTFNYQKTTFLNNWGQNKWTGLLLGLDKKLMGRKEIQMYLNGNSYGLPYYFTSPKLQQVNKQKNKLFKSQQLCL